MTQVWATRSCVLFKSLQVSFFKNAFFRFYNNYNECVTIFTLLFPGSNCDWRTPQNLMTVVPERVWPYGVVPYVMDNTICKKMQRAN